MEKSSVALKATHAQAPSFQLVKDLQEALLSIGALESLKRKGKRVLIKPNIASPGGLYSTSPSVTYAIAKIFVNEGFDVTIGENPSIPTHANHAYEEYGLYEIAKQAGAKVVDFRSGSHSIIEVPGGSLFSVLEVTDYALQTDSIVSVAAMKSANIVTATLSVKNMKGVIPSRTKRKFHCEGLNEGIVDLMQVMKPDLGIIDGTFGKDLAKGCCYPVGLLIASEDPLAADSVCARIMGFDPKKIEHLRKMEAAGLGNLDPQSINVIGEKIEDHIEVFPFSKPKDPFEIAKKSNGRINIVQGDPCSVCLNELGTVMHLFQDRIDVLQNITILVGPKAADTPIASGRTVIGYGNCVKKQVCEYVVAGCPPTDYREAETGSLIDVFTKLLGSSK